MTVVSCFRFSLIYLVFLSFSAKSFCFDEAGFYYDINPSLLKAIAYTESRLKPDAVNKANSNGTVDYGLMQINSWWFETLADLGISKSDVINDPCINVFVGAWILAQNFKSHGEGWLAIGGYNAGFSKTKNKVRARDKYISLVRKNFEQIMKRDI
ncbi:lytic transglycosylase domain-containing protein [Psychromonas sp. KJ10-2]|uniref:lytic transglycosylase domain-containing protein n=1 Tax=Psychromonas sp. KJ10-2 TaxID=3391822 RepID=UPI0039B48E15